MLNVWLHRSDEPWTANGFLESELQSNLHNAWAKIIAHLSITNVVGPVTRLARRRYRAAEKIDRAPLGMIERVEGFKPELQSRVLTVKPR
jgi:hypothetical protein